MTPDYSLKKMNLTYLKAQNYRCYRNLEINFKPGINLLIGDNASGKTTILELGQSVCNTFLSGYHDENTVFRGLKKEAISESAIGETIENAKPIEVDFILFNKDGRMSLAPGANSKTTKGGLKKIREYGQSIYKNVSEKNEQLDELPILASFSTGDIHVKESPNRAAYDKYLQRPSFGYRDCFSQYGLLDYWVRRLMILEEAPEKAPIELAAVKRSIKKAMGPEGMGIITDVIIRLYKGGLYLKLSDGREVSIRNLSDGYRRILDIVIDLAFRCALLNKRIFNEYAGEKTSGVVFIDEIDLHLHPDMQKRILKGLQTAFPKIQFIATTHAPMVITGVPSNENNQVLKLSYDIESGYNITQVSGYGQNAATITKNILGVEPLDTEIKKEQNDIHTLLDEGELEEAMGLLAKLREKIGDTPEITELETLLSFFGYDQVR